VSSLLVQCLCYLFCRGEFGLVFLMSIVDYMLTISNLLLKTQERYPGTDFMIKLIHSKSSLEKLELIFSSREFNPRRQNLRHHAGA
jgi:hypothetical protein